MLLFHCFIRNSSAVQRNNHNEAGLRPSFVSVVNSSHFLLGTTAVILLTDVFHNYKRSIPVDQLSFSSRQHDPLHSTLSSLQALKPSLSDRPVLSSKPPQPPEPASREGRFSNCLAKRRLPVPAISSAAISFAMEMVLPHLPQKLPARRYTSMSFRRPCSLLPSLGKSQQTYRKDQAATALLHGIRL